MIRKPDFVPTSFTNAGQESRCPDEGKNAKYRYRLEAVAWRVRPAQEIIFVHCSLHGTAIVRTRLLKTVNQPFSVSFVLWGFVGWF